MYRRNNIPHTTFLHKNKWILHIDMIHQLLTISGLCIASSTPRPQIPADHMGSPSKHLISRQNIEIPKGLASVKGTWDSKNMEKYGEKTHKHYSLLLLIILLVKICEPRGFAALPKVTVARGIHCNPFQNCLAALPFFLVTNSNGLTFTDNIG